MIRMQIFLVKPCLDSPPVRIAFVFKDGNVILFVCDDSGTRCRQEPNLIPPCKSHIIVLRLNERESQSKYVCPPGLFLPALYMNHGPSIYGLNRSFFYSSSTLALALDLGSSKTRPRRKLCTADGIQIVE